MKKYFNKVILSIFTASSLFIIFGHGCGQFELSDGVLSSLSSESSSDFYIFASEKTVSTVYANQFLNNMISCTGLKSVDARTNAEFESRKGSMPEYGYATKITGPALMSIAAVAGELCADLIDQDSTLPENQKLFNGDLESVIQKLAISCWNRRADSSEVAIILSGVESDSDSISRNAASTGQYDDVLLSTCTSILASTSAIEM